MKTYHLVNSGNVFGISLLVAALTLLSVYFWGLGQHRTFFENSIISTTLLSIAFFLFVTVGLYRGIKLKDSIGEITSEKFVRRGTGNSSLSTDLPSADLDMDVGDGIVGVIAAIVLWILLAVLLSFLLWIFANLILVVVAAFMGMLYWIFFRALRLVFKNSNKSKGKLLESIKYGLGYTLLYNFWIYGIFLLTAYLRH